MRTRPIVGVPSAHHSQLASIDATISDTLKALRVRNVTLLHSLLSSRTGVAYSPKPSIGPSNSSVSTLHFVVSGSCIIETDREQRILKHGDLALLSAAGRQSILGSHCRGAVSFDDVARSGPTSGFWTVDYGQETDDRLEIISANVYWESGPYESLICSLPALIVDEFENSAFRSTMLDALRAFTDFAADGSSCVEIVLRNHVESVTAFIVQRYASADENHSHGIFLGAQDRIVARALQLLHQNINARWTVADLARKIGASRSVLNDRFRNEIGQAPIEYLNTLRMKIASQQLSVPGESISAVSRNVGYESEAAFNRAFKRFFGHAPGQWRDLHCKRPAKAMPARPKKIRNRAA